MADVDQQTLEYFRKQIRVGHLPSETTKTEIIKLFEPFGTIVNVYVKYRASRDSTVLLQHPYAFIIFDKSDTVDQVMASRPFFLKDCQLFVRRCLPINDKYSYEAFVSVKKILIRTVSNSDDEVLPDDNSIIEYLQSVDGKIEYFERLDDKAVLVQFDDYDPVDLCCLSRPHFINNQLVEIEKCTNEEQVRNQIPLQKKSQSNSIEFPPNTNTSDMDRQTRSSASPTPILSVDDRILQLRLMYNDTTNQKEREHEQLVAALSSEWERTAKERIRLQRLTLDYKNEHERLMKENRQWKKSFSDSIREKPNVQTDGERQLEDARNKVKIAEEKYNKLTEKLGC